MTDAQNRPMPKGAGSADNMVLTLSVGDQTCGLPVLSVRDVLGATKLTPIPLAPGQVAGSLNLRGRIVTAVDLRRRLGIAERPAGAQAMSVVVEHQGELYSLQADQVGEVITVDPADRLANPPTLSPAWHEFSLGVHRLDQDLLVLLSVERVIEARVS